MYIFLMTEGRLKKKKKKTMHKTTVAGQYRFNALVPAGNINTARLLFNMFYRAD